MRSAMLFSWRRRWEPSTLLWPDLAGAHLWQFVEVGEGSGDDGGIPRWWYSPARLAGDGVMRKRARGEGRGRAVVMVL